MNKAQFVEAVALEANISKVDARKAVDAMIRITARTLREGERLTLTERRLCRLAQKPERTGRPPHPGARVTIPPRTPANSLPPAEIE